MPEQRSANVLVQRALSDPAILQQIQANPQAELPRLAQSVLAEMPSPLQADNWIYRIVVGALGLAVLLSVVGAIFLSAQKITPIPDMLTAIGSAAVGALAGLLAPTPSPRQ